jgi:hypothetical protein
MDIKELKKTTKMGNNKIQIRNTSANFPVFTKQTSDDGIVETWRAASLRRITMEYGIKTLHLQTNAVFFCQNTGKYYYNYKQM